MARKLTEWNGSEFVIRPLTAGEEAVRDQDNIDHLAQIANPAPFRDTPAEIAALKARLDILETRGVFDNSRGHVLDNALNPVYEV